MKKLIIRLILLGVVGAAAWAGYSAYKSMPQRQLLIPTAKVRQSDVVVRSFTRGELRAVRSVQLYAPNLFGTVQVTQLAPLGAFAREKDLIAEFDDAEVQSRVEEKQLELDQIEEQIKKQGADLAIRNNQDQVELLGARYSVRKAELEVQRNELLPDIDKQKNNLNLTEAKGRLTRLQSDIKSRAEQAQAEIAVLNEKRNKARLEMSRERMRLMQVKLLAPMSGLVAIRQNRQQGFIIAGQQLPDIREGDQVQPGMPVADVLDLSELEVLAKVGELDRANLKEDQEVLIRLDALGDKTFHGKIKSMSGTASANVFSGDPAKKFDVIFSVDMRELMEGLGAKPDQIARVLKMAEANRKKGVPSMSAGAGAAMAAAGAGGGMPGAGGMAMGGGMPQGGGMQGGALSGFGGPPEGGAGGDGGQRRGMFRAGGGGPGGPGGAGMSDEDRTKMRAAMQKALNGRSMQDLSPEERTKLMAEVQKAVPGATMGQRGAGGRGGREGGGRDGGGMPGGMRGPGGFNEQEMAQAKLPPAIEEGNQLDVLLRPGLLADVEIILEKIPNAINIPNQAVFEKDGKLIVYVKAAKGWEERVIRPAKRSETVMVIAEGLKPGEQIAMTDPNAKPGAKKGDKPASSSPMGGMPGGKS